MAKIQTKSKRAETTTLNLKERLAEKRKANKSRQEFINLLNKSTGIGLLLGIMLFFAGGIKAAIPGTLGIIIIAFAYKYPRQALFTFMIYLPFGGTITYYLGNSPTLQLAKDAFYVPALIALWQNCRQQRLPFLIPKNIKTPLQILLGCCLITLIFINGWQQFNPPEFKIGEQIGKEIPIGMGILGLKVLLGYAPLITCAYYLIRNKADLLLFSRIQIVITLICCTLGIIQYLLLLTGVCQGTRGLEGDALFKASVDARCYFGGSLLYTPEEGVIRLPGTFVAPWQWAWFLISSTFFTFATAFTDPAIIWRIMGLVSLALVFINSVISGQRIALILVPISFITLLFFTGQIRNLKRFIPIGVGLAIILGIAMVTNPAVVQERLNSFNSRWDVSPPQEFIIQQFGDTWQGFDGIIGSGLGKATNSARSMGKTRLIETYYPKLLFEIGIVGVIAFLFLVTTLTVCAFKTYRSIKNYNLRTYGSTLWVFILFISYNTFYYPLDVDPVSVYYWFFAGIIFKLPVLDKQENEANAKLNLDKKKKRLI